VALAKLLLEKAPHALRATKEAIRAVRYMSHDQALQYLASKIQSLQAVNKGGSDKGIAQFIDEKSYRPGFGTYKV
jgi:trans-feruloyl-CoA hydratase/vanillin synthase